MKKFFNISLFSCLLLLGACDRERDTNYQWLETPHFSNPMTVSASSEEVMLEEAKENQTAVEFTWGEGNDRGAGTSLKYIVKLDLSINGFEQSIDPIEMPQGQRSISFTHGELNDLLLYKWKVLPQIPVNLSIRVIAQVEGGKQFQKPEIAEHRIAVTAYPLDPIPMFIVGDAITGGWDPGVVVEMEENARGTLYSFSGAFKAGDFVILTTRGEEVPSYGPADNATATGGSLVRRENTGQPERRFTIAADGEYTIRIDLTDNSFRISRAKPYETVCVAGSCIPDGYNMSSVPRMDWNEDQPNIYTWEGALTASSLLFVLDPDKGYDNSRFFQPFSSGEQIGPNGGELTRNMKLTPGKSPEWKWQVRPAGNYRIIIDVDAMTLTLQPI